MEWVETTGKTLDDAKGQALDQLGVAEEEAEFEVLTDAKPGLFGRMRSEARVRARVRPTQPRPKEDRRRRAPKSTVEPASVSRPDVSRPDVSPPDVVGGDQRPVGWVSVTDREAPPDDGSEDVPLADQAEVARRFLEGVVQRFELRGTPEVHPIDEQTVEVTVTGGSDLALLIGPRGATVSALQDLARTVVQRRTGARSGRLLVDVAGYRQKRRQALERFTRQVTAQVVETGQVQVLEPMTSSDRKVVHDTVNGIVGAATRSEGEEPRRRVVISPVET